jgi:Thioesterase-like superfamily
MTWPDRVSVYHKLRSCPSSSDDSIVLDAIILSERQQRAAARCQEDIVVYDYRVSKKTALREFMVSAFRETFRLQEEAREKNTERVLDLLRQVEALEKESWDREDAKEDFGSAIKNSS